METTSEPPQNPACCAPSRPEDKCAASEILPLTQSPDDSSTRGMVQLEGGSFLMGYEGPEARMLDGEGPVREVVLDPFWIDRCTVTNAEFEVFVGATGYLTEAEKWGWSFVFHRHLSAENKRAARGVSGEADWWVGVERACWRRPEGPGSNLKKRLDHPVVHISWNDARAYCGWVGKQLPTEAQWEYAARGGLVQQLYPWGNELTQKGKNGRSEHRCNIWQGKFPDLDTGADGFTGTAPAKNFAPNGFGLYQTSGNVWEWCADWFSASFHRDADRFNPSGPPDGTHKVTKGGSFLCHASYCNRYRVAARTANTPDSTTSHTGFRCVLNRC